MRCNFTFIASVAVVLGLASSPVLAGQDGVARGPAIGVGMVPASSGELVLVPLSLTTDQPIVMLSWSVEFNPEHVQFVDATLPTPIQNILDKNPDASRFVWEADNEIGTAQLSLVLDFQGRVDSSLPPGLLRQVGLMHFQLDTSISNGQVDIRLTRNGEAHYESIFENSRGPVYNAVRRAGVAFEPGEEFEDIDEPDLGDGGVRVSIIGDIGIFARGDVNLDKGHDLGDTLRLLNALFHKGPALLCPQTADTNVDGRVDLADALNLLNWLFVRPGGATASLTGDSEATMWISCRYTSDG